MRKSIEKLFFAILAVAVLGAGTVSAHQLQSPANILPVCRGACSATVHCAGGCICEILSGTSGGCVRDPGPAKPI